MRKTTRLQSAQALALAAVCAVQVVAPGLAQAQTPPATPVPPPPAAPVAPPPAVAPVQPSAAAQPAVPPPPAAPAPGMTTPPMTTEPTAPETGEPVVPAAAEPSAPPAYVEPMAAPAEPPTQIEAAPPTIDEQLVSEPKSKVPSYLMWGIGGASLITGVVLGVTALTAKSDFNDSPTYSGADKVEGRAVAADIAFGLSAVLLVTGTVFYFLPDSQESRPHASNNPKRTTARVQVTPMLGRTNGGAVSIQF